MDGFDVALSNGWDLTIIGRLDNTLKEANIEITFEQISFVSIPLDGKPILQVVSFN